MSHHLDTPLASQNGQLYIDDLDVFLANASTVLVMDVNSNITGVQHPQLRPGAHIGLWGATKLATDAGGWRQINRAGHPMMWPIFWPDDTHFTNPANTRHPSKDFDAEGTHIAEHVAAVVAASGTSDDPQGYGETVARELFPDVLPYVVGTPARG